MSVLYDRVPGAGGPLPPGYRLGRYEIMAKLASGGMAMVYVANVQGLGGFERVVALKVLHANLAYEEEFIRMFLDEARLAARIRHPNVVATIDISDTAETGYYLVMEYVEGDHLGALLAAAHKAGERLPVPVILRIAVDALSGLSAAHDLRDDNGRSLQMVHRDVSPHNILVGCDGVARLTDFGVAKAEDRLTHTRDGQVKGKLAYMAPEQASTGTSDSRSDLFSMGIILWECVTGRRLFRAENTAATLTKLLNEEIALPSAIDPGLAPLDYVLTRALQRDPDRRFQSADELIEALERAAAAFGGLASRRALSKAVEQYAGEKMSRERTRIAAARSSVLGDTASEIAAPAEASLPSSSLSRSKPSGVLSHATAPGRLRRRSSRPMQQRTSGEYALPAKDALEPPPPLGAHEASLIPEAPRPAPFELDARAPRSGLVLWVLFVAACFAIAIALLARAPQPTRAPRATPRARITPPAAIVREPIQVPAEPAREAPPALEPIAVPVPSANAPAHEATPPPHVAPTAAPSSVRGAPHVLAPAPTLPHVPPPSVHITRRPDLPEAEAQPAEPAEDLLPNPYKR